MARFNTLAGWLAWQETLNPAGIELGLERVRSVLDRLGHADPPFAVVTVGGTNGKGSSVALLESILLAAGYRVGSYTSPHLLRYNERVRIQGGEVSDARLCAAFDRVDLARGDIPLTYFEFGTLAAIDIFVMEEVLDIVLLEVGLGGRLDAVNVLDSDVALVTSVGIDHQEWLGPDRDAIGREKAGIFRRGRPAVCGDPEPPASLLQHARQLGVTLLRAGQDFDYQAVDGGWRWRGGGRHSGILPLPALKGAYQLQNAAAVLMVVAQLEQRFPVGEEALRRGLERVVLPGRFQVFPGAVTRIFDVGHNPHAAAVLAGALAEHPSAGRTLAVVGMLDGKDHEGVFRLLCSHFDEWYAADLDAPRDAGSRRLSAAIGAICGDSPVRCFTRVASAYRQAMHDARPGDRVVVFGSFYTVAEALSEAV